MANKNTYVPVAYTDEQIETALELLLQGDTVKSVARQLRIKSNVVSQLRKTLTLEGGLPSGETTLHTQSDFENVWTVLKRYPRASYATIAQKAGFHKRTVVYMAAVGRVAGKVTQRRKHDEETQHAAVLMVLDQRLGAAAVADKFEVTQECVRQWLKDVGYQRHYQIATEREQIFALVRQRKTNAEILAEMPHLNLRQLEYRIKTGFYFGELTDADRRPAKGGNTPKIHHNTRRAIIRQLKKAKGRLSLLAIANKYGISKSMVNKIAATLDDKSKPRTQAAKAKHKLFTSIKKSVLKMLDEGKKPNDIMHEVKRRYKVDIKSSHISRYKSARDRAEGKITGYRRAGNPGKSKPQPT